MSHAPLDDADLRAVEAQLGRAPRDIVARMLRNLKEIHRAQEDWQRVIAVQNRLLILLPDAWAEYRDRGLAHAEQGHSQRAVEDLETYLVHAQDALDIDAIADRVADLRREMEGRIAADARRGADVRAGDEQHRGELGVAIERRPVQRRHAVALRAVDVTAVLQELFHRRTVFSLRGLGNGGRSLSRRRVGAKADANRSRKRRGQEQREEF